MLQALSVFAYVLPWATFTSLSGGGCRLFSLFLLKVVAARGGLRAWHLLALLFESVFQWIRRLFLLSGVTKDVALPYDVYRHEEARRLLQS